MATQDQASFIKDLILAKFRTFSEFKKWLATTGVVRTNGQIFTRGINLNEIINRISASQASAVIDLMTPLADVTYKSGYDQEQIDQVDLILGSIKKEVESWTFI